MLIQLAEVPTDHYDDGPGRESATVAASSVQPAQILTDNKLNNFGTLKEKKSQEGLR